LKFLVIILFFCGLVKDLSLNSIFSSRGKGLGILGEKISIQIAQYSNAGTRGLQVNRQNFGVGKKKRQKCINYVTKPELTFTAKLEHRYFISL